VRRLRCEKHVGTTLEAEAGYARGCQDQMIKVRAIRSLTREWDRCPELQAHKQSRKKLKSGIHGTTKQELTTIPKSR
jgi:hypothetical protein